VRRRLIVVDVVFVRRVWFCSGRSSADDVASFSANFQEI
jgi:hypothetical protein